MTEQEITKENCSEILERYAAVSFSTADEMAAAWRVVYNFLLQYGLAEWRGNAFNTLNLTGIETVIGFLEEKLTIQTTQPCKQ